MLVLVVCLVAVAAATPALDYDQRQEGERNIRVDIHNVAVILAKPAKRPNYDILEILSGLKRKSGNVVTVSHDTDMDSTKGESESMEKGDDDDDDPEDDLFVVKDGKLSPYLTSTDDINSTKVIEDCGPGKYRDTQGVCRSSVLPETHTPSDSLGSSNVTVDSEGDKPYPDKGDKSYESFYGELIKKWATSTTTIGPLVSKNDTASS